MQVDNTEASSAHGLAQAGPLVREASVRHRAGLLVRLLGAGEVLSAALVVVVTLETPMAVALTEEVMEGVAEEAIGKSKE